MEGEKEKIIEAKQVKVEKIYKTKDLVMTAIIAFLIGAIITAGGFAINKTLKGGRDLRDFKQNGIQRSIGPGEFDSNNMQEQQPNNQKLIKYKNVIP